MKRVSIFIFIVFFSSSIIYASSTHITFLLSWNLRPYWDFVFGFRSQGFKKDEVLIIGNENFWIDDQLKKAKFIVSLGHRAYNKLLNVLPSCPIFAALIVAPEMIKQTKKINLCGGMYLRLPPEIFLPIVKQYLSKILTKEIVLGIPYTSKYNKAFVQKVIEESNKWNIKVIAIDLKQDPKILTNIWSYINVLYLIPDPFLESEEAIVQIIKRAVLHNIPVIGYNNFFLEKGAFLALVIDYKEAGRMSAKIVKHCLIQENFCGWYPAPFKVRINKKWKKLYKSSNF